MRICFKMFSLVLLTLLVFFVMNRNNYIGSNFVTIGNYSEGGINLDTCGLRYEPIIHHLIYPKKCFKNSYPNTTYFEEMGFLWNVGSGYINKRIIEGDTAEFGEFPWAVLVSFREFNDPIKEVNVCTGNLIAFQWVLTAAHCLLKDRLIYVFAGGVERGKGIMVKGSHKFIHPSYDYWNEDERRKYDLGLIKLDKRYPQLFIDSESNFVINTICLPKESFKRINKIEIGYHFGFGFHLFNDTTNQFLRRMNVTINPTQHSCYGGAVICSNITGQQSYKGDSGGGLVYYKELSKARAILIGSSSGGDPRKRENYFTPIARNVRWILKTIKENSEIQ